jgi:hypothetical protein
MGSGRSGSSWVSKSSKGSHVKCRVSDCDRAVGIYNRGKHAKFCKKRKLALKVLFIPITDLTLDACGFGPECDASTSSKDRFCDKREEPVDSSVQDS